MSSESIQGTPVSELAMAGQREFSTHLILELAQRPGNLLVSPFSVWSVLALLYPGARGETREMLAKVLGVGDEVATDRSVGWMFDLSSTRAKRKQFELIVANGLWVQEGYRLQPDYLREVSDRFNARIEQVDFQRRPDAACGTINSWADEKTRGRIRQVLSPAEIDVLTRLVLANATYFKDKWLFQFNVDLTEPKPFHRLDGGDVEVQMMHQMTDLLYFESRGLQAVTLLYLQSDLSMTVVLPKKIREFEADLTPEGLEQILVGPFESRRVFLGLPRYRFEGELELVPTLGELGLGSLFGDSADLSGISAEPGAHVDQVKQLTFVKVDEEGTEAAAVTTAVTIGALQPELLTPKVMVVDRPYWFFIRDEKARITLFAGRVEDPS